MKSRLLARFSAVALGFRESLAPLTGTPEEQAWASEMMKTLADSIKAGPMGSLRPIEEPTEGQLKVLEAMVARRGREELVSLAESLTQKRKGEPGRVFVACNERRPVILGLDSEGRLTAESGFAGPPAKGRGGKKPLPMEDRALASVFKSPSKSERRISLAAQSAFGGDARQIARWASGGMEGAWTAVFNAYLLSVERWQSDAERQLETLSAESAARSLYPEPLAGLMGAKLRLAAIQFGDSSSLKVLWSPQAMEGALELMDQTPGVASLAAAFATAALNAKDRRDPLKLDKDFAGQLKAELKSRFYLTDAGWRALARHSDREPEFASRLASVFAEAASAETHFSESRPGYRAPLKDGSCPTGEQAEAVAVCRCASLCAEQGLSLGDGLAIAIPQLAGVEDDSRGFGSMLMFSPRHNRDQIHKDEQLSTRPKKGVREGQLNAQQRLYYTQAQAARDEWEALLKKQGVPPEPLLSPRGFELLRLSGWTPSGEGEQRLAAMERDRQARFEKTPRLIGAVARRRVELASSPERFEQESSALADMLMAVEPGFWEQAPEKMSWAWLKGQSDQWHDNVIKQKASGQKWSAIEPGDIVLSSGWIARELIDGGELHAEGQKMSHCVSSYAKSCAEGRARVFSLRRELGNLKSTVEYRCSYPKGEEALDEAGLPRIPSRLTLAQHRAFANAAPSLEAQLAQESLARRLGQACEAAWEKKSRSSPGR